MEKNLLKFTFLGLEKEDDIVVFATVKTDKPLDLSEIHVLVRTYDEVIDDFTPEELVEDVLYLTSLDYDSFEYEVFPPTGTNGLAYESFIL